MIIVRNGIMVIPDAERGLNFAADADENVKTFEVYGSDGAGIGYRLCLSFDDGALKTEIPLAFESIDDGMRLSWNAARADVLREGIVWASLKILFEGGRVAYTDDDFFVARTSAQGSDSPSGTDPVYDYLEALIHEKADKTTTVAGLPLSGDIAATALLQAIGAVPLSRKIANLALSGDISATELAEQLFQKLTPALVTPGVTRASFFGQFATDVNRKPLVASSATNWQRIALSDDLDAYYTKSEIDAVVGNIGTLLSTV